MSGRVAPGLGSRIACSAKAYIPRRGTTSSLLSRNSKSSLRKHRLAANTASPLSAVLGPRPLYRSLSSRSGVHSGRGDAPSAERDAEQLVLSDAQRRTIYALSTPPGKAGVAVIRVSGPDALEVWRQVVQTRREGKGKAPERDPEPWKMHRCHVVHPRTQEVLDDGLAVFFKGPKSFTTEDVLELHVHSGRAIISSVLRAIACLPFCRPAERGEFTRRAFEGGRLDLTQVEGLRDLIDAETETQRKLALRNAEGATRARLEHLRKEIIQCMALVEALIDFGEGEDIEEGVYDQARERVQKLRATIAHHLSDNRRGEIMRSGVRLAIFGPPNAGKSSLLNFLAQREAAIVTPVPGTTRDILEVSLDIGGLPVIVADTAGLRHTTDVVEKIGVERARKLVETADIALCVLPANELCVRTRQGRWRLQVPPSLEPLLKLENNYLLLTKTDLLPADNPPPLPKEVWQISLKTGAGTPAFLLGLARLLRQRFNLLSEDGTRVEEPLITHARHRTHLENALGFLDAFLATPPEDVVPAAEELRYAAQAIGKISGLIDVEDILDAVFRDFCIGK
ncbi:tRNA modification GTPase GTPBP3, mitochondrial [Trametes pubescens]|uniref:tRNA modification GTPase GTPBP3, mitochondrial n=1 Tax=Trametes pubescens TaxID=154538 RepID=A0A1M2W092_TRAPU|nr:tRNA modification GTPase GTPBP3, mitochondrial [Trametes pubescens]